MKILVVEDEPVLRDGLCDLLRGEGYEVTAAVDGEVAVREGTESLFDLVLLDLTLPKVDGIDVCRRLRTARPGLPVLMLTARGSEEERIRGLKAGADDYVTKPFSSRELLARIEAFGRRKEAAPAEPETIQANGCDFDLGRLEGVREGETFVLTPREAGILRLLFRNKSRAVSRAELLEQVWGAPGHLETRTVDVAIANLRQKIEETSSEPKIVVSVKGVGYAWGSS